MESTTFVGAWTRGYSAALSVIARVHKVTIRNVVVKDCVALGRGIQVLSAYVKADVLVENVTMRNNRIGAGLHIYTLATNDTDLESQLAVKDLTVQDSLFDQLFTLQNYASQEGIDARDCSKYGDDDYGNTDSGYTGLCYGSEGSSASQCCTQVRN